MKYRELQAQVEGRAARVALAAALALTQTGCIHLPPEVAAGFERGPADTNAFHRDAAESATTP